MSNNNQFISKLKDINLFDGIFTGEVSFRNGLNIISGENGTGKTKLLQLIKNGNKEYINGNTNKIVIFNPKRNAEKQNLEHFANKLRSQNLDSKKINDILNQQNINDASFLPYPSFGELFIISYEEVMDAGDGSIPKKTAVENIKNDFNSILEKVFPTYKIIAEWKDGKLQFQIQKNGKISYPLEGLSCGESEVLSLMFNIYANKEKQDIYLIDEPEIHLNWSLEEGLFNFFDWFCNEYNKQIIIATHSRMIFQGHFLKKTQFLIWKDGKIIIDNKISKDISDKIAGDSIKIISALKLNKQTFFVEDKAHMKVIEELSKATNRDLGAIELGNCSAVQSFCRAAQKENMQNAYFLVDGDNQNIPKDLRNVSNYIHLKKYCIENYFLDIAILSEISNPQIDENQIKQKIKECIISLNSDSKTLVFKKLAEIADIPNEILDTFDASRIVDSLANKIGLVDFQTLAVKFISKAKEKDSLDTIFGEIFLKVN